MYGPSQLLSIESLGGSQGRGRVDELSDERDDGERTTAVDVRRRQAMQSVSNSATDDVSFEPLVSYLRSLPSIHPSIGRGHLADRRWWVKFSIDIEHALARRVVQEFGHVLNYVSLENRLPTVFMPVSPPPYLNGGPKDFLSWVIECNDPEFAPSAVAASLEERLLTPPQDPSQWPEE